VEVGGVQADKCPGVPVLLKPGKNEVTLDFTGSKNDHSAKGCDTPLLFNSDLVMALSATESGQVNAEIPGSPLSGGSLYVRSQCGMKDTELACSKPLFPGEAEINFPIGQGQELALIAEGGSSKIQLTLTLTPDNAATCGNNVLDPTEPCDDGNNLASDGCKACQVTAACTKQEQSPSNESLKECKTMNFFPAKLSSLTEDDWYCAEVAGGGTIVAQTYTGIPGHCTKTPANTIAEIYKGPPVEVNSFSCLVSSALVCNDDHQGTSCSRVTYTVPPGQGGKYCVRVARSEGASGGEQIPEYGVVLSVK
jgi:cysteine-rich repeat protein